ncbi:hypothetical protein [Nocardiopsis sp. HUAS JQ3]|uniref:hypothetical protein n=1 Tax=Nocardiopsis sp. HUAS JQ3 TaxID=3061629 RepID=UPI0023A988D4|nr:hypothetical protein [Nocardiopsis sp. HUAS JQ3]WDZ90806.1 hypothetical protein PV789_28680 [Nocardiopsis sp. HUAS JQ3]
MRYLIQFFVMLWRAIAPPARGRHTRSAPPPARTQAPCRRTPVRRRWEWQDPPPPPPEPVEPPVERDLIPPYYRAWEQARTDKRSVPDHLGGDLLHVITPAAPPPRPPGDLTDLAAVVRQWHTAQAAQTAQTVQAIQAARTFEGVRA